MSIADRIAGIPRGLPGVCRSQIDAYRCGHQEAIQAAVRIGVEADEAIRELTGDRDSWREQAHQRVLNWDAMRIERDQFAAAATEAQAERDAAREDRDRLAARVAELEAHSA